MIPRHVVSVAAAAALALGVSLAACGGGNGGSTVTTGPRATPYAPAIDPARFSNRITNRYLPYVPGTVWVYEGTDEGEPRRDEVTVTRDTKTVMGVRCVVVHDVVTAEGELVEETFDWYAQDADGNVWYFGEDSKDYEGGKVVSTKGSWEAGVDGALPGIVMKAAPAAGDTYQQEYYPGEAEDMARVLQLDASLQVPAGSYSNVIVTEDFSALDPGKLERKHYAPGAGLVKAEMVKGGEEESHLVSITTQ